MTTIFTGGACTHRVFQTGGLPSFVWRRYYLRPIRAVDRRQSVFTLGYHWMVLVLM